MHPVWSRIGIMKKKKTEEKANTKMKYNNFSTNNGTSKYFEIKTYGGYSDMLIPPQVAFC